MTEAFELSTADRHSNLWLQLEKRYQERLVELRSKNDGHVDEHVTADTRGRIAEVKLFLALGQEPRLVSK